MIQSQIQPSCLCCEALSRAWCQVTHKQCSWSSEAASGVWVMLCAESSAGNAGKAGNAWLSLGRPKLGSRECLPVVSPSHWSLGRPQNWRTQKIDAFCCFLLCMSVVTAMFPWGISQHRAEHLSILEGRGQIWFKTKQRCLSQHWLQVFLSRGEQSWAAQWYLNATTVAWSSRNTWAVTKSLGTSA